MRVVQLIESRTEELVLSDGQAHKLRHLGRQLASDRSWWGATDDEDADRTVIAVKQRSDKSYEVRIVDAIGVVSLGALQLVVNPKIPLNHFVYILQQSDQLPRLAEDTTEVAKDLDFFELIAHWFLTACERLLRRDLIRDYTETTGDLRAVRGRLHLVPTTRSVLSGRPIIRCEYDSFTEDNALNRLLAAAAQILVRSTALSADLRRRARRIDSRIRPVGVLRGRSDLNAIPDSRSRHYFDAHALALLILKGHGIAPSSGPIRGGTFLIRTPESIEEGVRQLLKRLLAPHWAVDKQGHLLAGSRRRTLNPDLVFGESQAVGDIKYRISRGRISTPNLYQATSFAAGYRVNHALLVEFGPGDQRDYVQMGAIRVESINWDILSADPAAAGNSLARGAIECLRQQASVPV